MIAIFIILQFSIQMEIFASYLIFPSFTFLLNQNRTGKHCGMTHILENSSASTSISKLYLKADIADVNFVFKHDQQTIQVPAHKTILASGSSVFRAMFFGLLPEEKLVEIIDASVTEFQEFLQLFYLSSLTLTIKNMDAVVRLADKYDVYDCLIASFGNLEDRLTDENAFWAYQWAVALNNERLQQLCLDKCNGTFLTKKIFESKDFMDSSQSVLKRILHAGKTTCSEVDVFNACLAWSKSLCREKGLDEKVFANVKEQLGCCFYLIRFGAMPQKEIGKIMADKSDLFSREELVELLWKDQSLTTFNSQPRKNINYLANKNAELVLKRRLNGEAASNVKLPQSTFFSSNDYIELGTFACAPIVANVPDNVTFHFEILKYDSIDRRAAHSVLYKGKIKYTHGNCPSVKLTENIIIKPDKMYEIRCWSAENRTYRIRNSWRDDGYVKLTSFVKITLHKFTTNGIVSSMRFKAMQ